MKIPPHTRPALGDTIVLCPPQPPQLDFVFFQQPPVFIHSSAFYSSGELLPTPQRREERRTLKHRKTAALLLPFLFEHLWDHIALQTPYLQTLPPTPFVPSQRCSRGHLRVRRAFWKINFNADKVLVSGSIPHWQEPWRTMRRRSACARWRLCWL